MEFTTLKSLLTELTKEQRSKIVKQAKKGKDFGKKGKTFDKIAKEAAKRYGSEEVGRRVAGAIFWKMMNESDSGEIQQVDVPSAIADVFLLKDKEANGPIIDKGKIVFVDDEGKYHRTNGPAVIESDGTMWFYNHGKLRQMEYGFGRLVPPNTGEKYSTNIVAKRIKSDDIAKFISLVARNFPKYYQYISTHSEDEI